MKLHLIQTITFLSLLLVSTHFSCREEEPLTEVEAKTTAVSEFSGSILEAEFNTKEQIGWEHYSSRLVQERENNSRNQLSINSTFFLNTGIECASSFPCHTTLMSFSVTYYVPFVDQVIMPTPSYLAEGVKTFHKGSQAGFIIELFYNDKARNVLPAPLAASTSLGDQSNSHIEIEKVSKIYNNDEERMEYEVELKINAKLYDREGHLLGNMDGRLITKFH